VDGTQLRFHEAIENGRGYQASLVPDANVGLWMYSPDFYLGVSSAQIRGTPLGFEYYRSGTESQCNVLQRHCYFTGGLRVPFNREWTMVPSVLLRYTTITWPSVDVSAKFRYKRLLWLGASLRGVESASGLFGINFNSSLSLSYTYDLGVSNLAQYRTGSHEVMLGLRVITAVSRTLYLSNLIIVL